MNSFRAWLFRGLVIAAFGLMLVSWFMPWWRCSIFALGGRVEVHPWGLEHNLVGPDADFIAGAEMPAWFGPLAWIYLGLCIVLLLFSLLAKEKKFTLGKFKLSLPQVLIGGVGLSYIVVVVVAVIFAAIRSQDLYGTPLIGTSYVSLLDDVGTGVESNFLFGYWLACGVGPLLLVLALLRDKIIGRPS